MVGAAAYLATVRGREVPINKEDEVYFLDQEYSGLYDDKDWECIECNLNLPETSHLNQKSIESCSHL
jgi:hypothetical protein